MQRKSSFSGGGSLRIWYVNRFLCLLALALLVFAPYTVQAMEYGETGPYRVVSETFENPMWPLSDGGTPVTVLLPSGHSGRVPVLFFSHGLGGTSWTGYRSLLQHVVSWGVAVVYSPYPTSLDWSSQYEILWHGFQEAADLYAADFDLGRVGFAGHSWGGGATPNMALRGVEAGWGDEGLFMFIMAPSPAYGVSDAELRSLTHAKMIMQVYENDTICPHSWADSTYEKVDTDQKAYYYVYGGDHFTPTERGALFSDLGRLAVWEPLDALMDFTFKLDQDTYQNGMMYALYGEGDHYETDVTGMTGDPPANIDEPADPPPVDEPTDRPPVDEPVVNPPADPPADEPVNTSYTSRWGSWTSRWFNRSTTPNNASSSGGSTNESSSGSSSGWSRWLDRYQSNWR